MNIRISLLAPALLLLHIFSACKKDNGSNSVPVVSDTTLSQVRENLGTGNGWIMGMAFHPQTGIVYIYQERTGGKGFYIHAYNATGQSYTTVYEMTDPVWSNSNGSEGARIRIDGNRLWVSGGFTNNRIICLQGLESRSPVFEKEIPVSNPYDIAFSDSHIFVASSSGGIISIDRNNTAAQISYPFASGETSFTHNSSIWAVNGQLAVIRGNRLEIRSFTNTFIRSVNINDGSVIQKDAKNRIYIMQENKILRYSTDLSQMETFPVQGISAHHATYGFVLKEEGNYIQIYFKKSGVLYTLKIAD